ncbi:MAG: hypothetical protein ACOCWR_07710, partial [Oceanidesulfovibrio sp.]
MQGIHVSGLRDSPLSGLPRDAVQLLVMGATGKHHLLHASRVLFNATNQLPPDHAEHSARVGLDLMIQAWVDDPLDGGLAESIRSIHERHDRLFEPLPPSLANSLATVASMWSMPEDDSEFLGLFETRDADTAFTFLDSALSSSEHVLYRL